MLQRQAGALTEIQVNYRPKARIARQLYDLRLLVLVAPAYTVFSLSSLGIRGGIVLHGTRDVVVPLGTGDMVVLLGTRMYVCPT